MCFKFSILCLMITFASISLENFIHPVQLTPSKKLYFSGDQATLICTAQYAVDIQWKMNNAILTTENEYFNIFITSGRGLLTTPNITLAYNSSDIICYANFTDTEIQSSQTVILLVQGVVEPVSGIDIHYENGKLLTVSWQRPFTLEDVTDVKPNITYNIRILNRTQNAETVIVVADEVVNTIYNANLSLIWCPKISIEIAAINRVGSSRVTSKALWSKEISIRNMNVEALSGTKKSVIIFLEDFICLDNVNVQLNDSYNIRPIKTGISNLIEFEMKENLKFKEVKIQTVYDDNVFVKSLGSMSTFDAQDIFVSSHESYLCLYATFASNSSSGGVLCAVLHVKNFSIDYSKSTYIILKKSHNSNKTKSIKRIHGSYQILCYDIKTDGYVIEKSDPAVIENVFVLGNSTDIPHKSKRCEAKRKADRIFIRCYCYGYYQVVVLSYNGTSESSKRITLAKHHNCQVRSKIKLSSNTTHFVTVLHQQSLRHTTSIDTIFEGVFYIKMKNKSTNNYWFFFLVVIVPVLVITMILVLTWKIKRQNEEKGKNEEKGTKV